MLLKNSAFYLIVSVILLLLGLSLVAEEKVLYKKVDKNGRVIFTDKPVPGSKKMVINTNKNVMSIPKGKTKSSTAVEEDADKDKEAQAYEVLAIEQPSHDEAVRANDGNLYVIVALTPHLAREHCVRLLMDGATIGADQKVPYFSLTNIDRGTHQLTAQIINDETGEILQSSDTRTFHLLKTSILQNNRINR
ncbi:MAG: DUF4124 domain-containing protein [Gammaproteobacteria bacterium]|nr:DUF4124 domain-containing protein [Gammaproteobacteria bacterium]